MRRADKPRSRRGREVVMALEPGLYESNGAFLRSCRDDRDTATAKRSLTLGPCYLDCQGVAGCTSEAAVSVKPAFEQTLELALNKVTRRHINQSIKLAHAALAFVGQAYSRGFSLETLIATPTATVRHHSRRQTNPVNFA